MSLNQFPRRAFVGSSTIQSFTGNGSQTTYTLSSSQSQNECFIFVDDVVQVPGVDFTVNGTALTFISAPANTAEIIVRGFGVPAPITTVSDGSITDAKLAVGAIEAKLGYTPVSPTQLNNLIDSAPTALDTLNELAAALGDDANYAATITTALSAKASTSYVDTQISAIQVTPTQVSDKVNTSTGYLQVPSGTTAQRPLSAANGMLRYNTTTGNNEIYQAGQWLDFATPKTTSVSYLIIAGGGGGGHGTQAPQFAGGGAGGVLQGTTNITPSTSYNITVGAGGPGTGGGSSGNGANSSAFSLTSIGGGGGGGGGMSVGGSGGSGGGQGGSGGGGTPNNAAGTAGQGNAGGSGTSPQDGAGGGGGFSSVGENASGATPGNGGTGLTSTISGTSTTYAGGGGRTDRGFRAGYIGSPSAIANSGSGGGGSTGNGGSGVVIISYSNVYKLASASGTYSYANIGGNNVYTFTGSGTITF